MKMWLLVGGLLAAIAAGSVGVWSQRSRPGPVVSGGSTAAAVASPALPAVSPIFGSDWKTDFSKASVPLDEIRSGGPPRDGIPPIDRPVFESVADARRWLQDREPVIVLTIGGESRAYPLQILIWHEIVNDTIGGLPVAVTFCPLCNTAIAFDRRLGGVVYDFGTTGKLRNSDLVMWDRQTQSWWQQITGEAIVGTLIGSKLTAIPAPIVSAGEFRAAFPAGSVLSRETGFDRPYGQNPYVGYDDVESSPFLFNGKPDSRLRPMERVVAVEIAGQRVVYPFGELARRRVIEDAIAGRQLVVFFTPGTASALDQSAIAMSRDIGATGVFAPVTDGRQLRFRLDGDRIVDQETGSTWSVLGKATNGPLTGAQLPPIVHGDSFWFVLAAFYPDVRIWRP
jgi:hypothetical protein